jgi:hypothetical protein
MNDQLKSGTMKQIVTAMKEKEKALKNPIKATNNWEPKGGDFFIQSNGKMSEVVGGSDTQHREFGVERPTRQQAERACIEMRRFNRLLALRDELCSKQWDGDWDFDNFNTYKYFLTYIIDEEKWIVDWECTVSRIGVYFTTGLLAQKAADMLNSGEVIL